jgi:hypothetical protein
MKTWKPFPVRPLRSDRKLGASALAVLLLLPIGAGQAQDLVSRNVLRLKSPKMTVRVSPELHYLGHLSFKVEDTAEAEEYVFADVRNGRLQRAFIAHFEHFLSDNNRQFNYPRLNMATLDGHEYLHQTWALADFALFHVPKIKSFLSSRNINSEPNWLVDRYVRVVDETRKGEVIFFYLESGAANQEQLRYTERDQSGPPLSPEPEVEKLLVEHAMRAFQVTQSSK